MGINIGGRAEIRVAEPFLDLLQRHAVSQQQAGAAMAKIMKPHLRHPVFCYVLRKVLRQIVQAHALSQSVHKDITVVLVVIAIAANFLVEFLRFLDLLKVVAEAPHQGKRSQARFGLSRILLDAPSPTPPATPWAIRIPSATGGITTIPRPGCIISTAGTITRSSGDLSVRTGS